MVVSMRMPGEGNTTHFTDQNAYNLYEGAWVQTRLYTAQNIMVVSMRVPGVRKDYALHRAECFL